MITLPPDVHFDFAVALTLLTLCTGVVWALDKWWLGPRRRRDYLPGEDKPGAIVDFSRSFFPVILAVLILRSFVVEPFRIPSGSMIPTLLIGDFILVNKFAYGLRDPVFHWRFWDGGLPQRGDIVVFRYPHDPSKDYVKRVVGLPGDRLAYRDKLLYVNGEPVRLDAAGVYAASGSPATSVHRFTEALGPAGHAIIVNPARPAEDFPPRGFEFELPLGQYFMMGDNRDGSEDSRRWGTVPERNLVGRAFFIWMSWDGARNWPDFSRIGNRVQ